ncbi:hypothetical protein Tco_1261611 [Tanacetum coccineum]
MIPLFHGFDEPCPVCRKDCLDSLVSCWSIERSYWFQFIGMIWLGCSADVLNELEFLLERWPPCELSDRSLEGRFYLTASLIYSVWVEAEENMIVLDSYWSLSPLVGLRDTGFVAGQAAVESE